MVGFGESGGGRKWMENGGSGSGWGMVAEQGLGLRWGIKYHILFFFFFFLHTKVSIIQG